MLMVFSSFRKQSVVKNVTSWFNTTISTCYISAYLGSLFYPSLNISNKVLLTRNSVLSLLYLARKNVTKTLKQTEM